MAVHIRATTERAAWFPARPEPRPLATGGIALNVLLGQADSRNDPVGNLTPRANISGPTPPASTPTTTQEQTETEVEEPDD